MSLIESLQVAFIESGLISASEGERLVSENRSNGGEQLWQTLVRIGLANGQDAARLAAPVIGVSYVDLADSVVPQEVLGLITRELAMTSHMLPLAVEGFRLVLAMEDPLDDEAISLARFGSGLRVSPRIAGADDLEKAIRRHYDHDHDGEEMARILRNVSRHEGLEFISVGDPTEDDVFQLKKKSEMTPIVELAYTTIFGAIIARASDLHLEPSENTTQIRHRVDGILVQSGMVPRWVHGPLVSRIKILSGMDIAKRNVPQDGKMKLKMENRMIDLRVSTMPTPCGEKVVIRILEAGSDLLRIADLGFFPDDIRRIIDRLMRPQGLILLCGPTGSGKTTTIYSLLSEVAKRGVNVVSVEDPIEYSIPGVTQIQVKEKAGLTFASILRSVLRQDPDVVFVGEIRDKETAEIALSSAVTGHLVLSTIHTNDALAVIPRLLDLGVERYLVATSLSAVISGRLLRRICEKCRDEHEPNASELARLRERMCGKELSFLLYRGSGCPSCQMSGYRGRIGVFEVLVVGAELRDLIAQGASPRELRVEAQRTGMRTIMDDALEKLRQGATTVEELQRGLFYQDASAPAPDLTSGGDEVGDPVAGERPQARAGQQVFKVLVVDDEEDMVRVLVRILTKAGYEVSTAANGMEALEVALRDPPHLVITDVAMPEMDGLRLIQALRQNVRTAFLPVITLSKKLEVADRLRAFEIGSDDYIGKPFSSADLLLRITRALGKAYHG